MSGERTSPDGTVIGGACLTWFPRCQAALDVILDGFEDKDKLGSPGKPLHVKFYPKSAKIHSNSYHQPDAWEMTFDARDCPFDPALIRQATVQIFLYDAGKMEDPPAGPDALMPMSDTVTELEPDIVGLFDDDSMELSDDGRWITVQGQDMTTLFSGKQWPPHPNGRAKRVPTGMKLDDFVWDRIREVNDSGRMRVSFDGDLGTKDMPLVGKDQPAGHRRGVPVKQSTTYWDVIYQTVIRHGFVCYVRGWNIVIAKPKNLEDYRNADIVKMAWGNNIEHLTLQRKLGKQNVPTIVVVAYDEKGQFSTRVQWPDPKLASKTEKSLSPKVASKIHSVEKQTIKGTTAQKAKAPKAGAKPKTTMVKKDEEFMIVPVHGTWSPESLLLAAKSLHTLIGRGERRIIVKTHDLQDINGKPLLHLMAGDAAEIHWQDFNSETMQAMSVEQRIRYLQEFGYQADVAQTLALAYDKLANKMNPPMRIHELTKDFDNEGGLSLEIELMDFAHVEPPPAQVALMVYTRLSR